MQGPENHVTFWEHVSLNKNSICKFSWDSVSLYENEDDKEENIFAAKMFTKGVYTRNCNRFYAEG